MLENLLYLIVFITAFMGPMLIVGAIVEYVLYDIMGEDPNRDYYDE